MQNEQNAGDPASGPDSNELLVKLLEHMEQNEAQLTKVASQLEQVIGAGDAASPEAETGAEEEDADAEPAGRLGAAVSFLVLVATMVMLGIAVLQSNLDPGGAANSGMAAAFNRELVQNINTSDLYAQYRSYTDYIAQAELQRQLEFALATAGAAQPGEGADTEPQLTQELAQAQRAAAASRLFFSIRYLNRDSTYDSERQLGEAWSRAEQQMDLEPEPYFADADQQRSVGMDYIWLLLWLTISLCIYEIVNYFNQRRLVLRLSFVVTATFCMAIVVIGIYLLMDA